MFDLADPFSENDIEFIREVCSEYMYELIQSEQ